MASKMKYLSMELTKGVSLTATATTRSRKATPFSDILDKYIQNDCVKKQGSHSRNLRRVHLGLGLIKALFEQFLDTEGTLYDVATTAYGQVCAQFHSWAIRKAVGAGMYTLPTREQLIVRLNETGFLLLARVIAATCCVTLSASMAAQLGSTPMVAFQICLQTWLAYSLLADGLAFAGQTILASAFARKDHPKATATASRILQLALVLGLLLSILLGVGLRIGSRLFTSDQGVLHHIYIGIPTSFFDSDGISVLVSPAL
ncbi:Protein DETOXIFICATION 42 [Zea mays]|uniref:Protein DETOXIFICATION 42 n=1 Tax=Zea mays TaxID=4577 RepID=A0A3L6FCD5_MAIZE|nr:Protein DETOXIFICATION 42 [Zea mays]